MNIYYKTAVTEISNPNDESRKLKVRVLADDGSGLSFITANAAKKLGLRASGRRDMSIYTFGGGSPLKETCQFVDVTFKPKWGEPTTLQLYTIPGTAPMPKSFPLPPCQNLPPIQDLADSGEFVDSPFADILLGVNTLGQFILNDHKRIHENLYLQTSAFGHLVCGEPPTTNYANSTEACAVLGMFAASEQMSQFATHLPDKGKFVPDEKALWELENLQIKDSATMNDADIALDLLNQNVEFKDGRYSVKLPWRTPPTELNSHYGLAKGRLSSIHKRLVSEDRRFLTVCDDIIKNYLREDIIEEVKDDAAKAGKGKHYLPHHFVESPGKSIPVRIVFDASSKLNRTDLSLNDALLPGVPAMQDLIGIMMRFRTGEHAMTADLRRAFLQIEIDPTDRDYLRFLWLKEPSKGVTEDNIVIYRFCRLPFGVCSSPLILQATLDLHLSQLQTIANRMEVKIVKRNFYVDDLALSSPRANMLIRIYHCCRQQDGRSQSFSQTIGT